MFKDFIGRKSNVVVNEIERGAVKKFAEAIGDLNPIYVDRDYGFNSVYRTNIAPPTFAQTLNYGEVEGFYLPLRGLIHGEQEFEYFRPLLVGEEINCYMEIGDYYEKQGKNGVLSFLIRNRYGEEFDTGELIYKITEVTVITETVKRGLMK